MSGTAIAIAITPVIDLTQEGGGGGISDGFLLENGTDFLLLETGDYLLQE